MEFATIFSVISVAFLSSISHCLGMCGGFVVACNAKLAKKPVAQIWLYNISYHISRILAYVVLGILFGLFGSFVIASVILKGYVFFAIGLFMVVLGVALIKRGTLLKFIENDKISQKFIMPKFKNLIQKDGILAFMLLGFLNGLLPCGVVYYFLALSLSAGSIANGALVMAAFGVSTLPAMLGFSGLVNLISGELKSKMNYISAGIIMLYGIYLAYLGFMAIK
ncbi:hypothetical membrane protein (DsbD domain) [Campylobacter iguaniorum]|uniref:Hypothetical membrane protein (DsbD domain) n=1 Tax=Campylobacter iguaniorum TaxID=1244531 RepID=A0A076F7V9_9BACT|nr:sulfite exporter TauE/SafE family protein [Campylobacter iguaniorum]AII14300.1 hypothetical membrane protein (DsbD domain) [Campylobacter iguaniorum]